MPISTANVAAAILADAATEVVVLALGPCKDDAAALGADRVLCATDFDASHYQPEAAVAWLQAVRIQMSVQHWFFADHTADGELGRRFATAIVLMAADVRIGADGPFKVGLPEVEIGMPMPLFAVEFARDRLSKRHFLSAVALAVTTQFISNVLPKMTPRWMSRLWR